VKELHERFQTEWVPALRRQQQDDIVTVEAIDRLLRSILPAFQPQWLAILERYARDKRLPNPESLPVEEADLIRHLRNLGLITHSGKWLFEPTPSEEIWPTTGGNITRKRRRPTEGVEGLDL
jgi:hypothetical protein